MPADSVESILTELSALRGQARSVQVSTIRKALTSKTNLVVAKAGSLVGELGLSELADDLVAMFQRFLRQPDKADKGCAAKTAAVKALYAMEADNAEVFLAGIRHVQMEPIWGGSVDTAIEMRGISALGLVRMRHRDALLEITALLANADSQARLAAVRAIAYDEGPAAIPLLRYKALLGDEETQVLGECLSGLLKLSCEQSLDFVAGFLDSANPEVSEAAAASLGGSRNAAALALLIQRWERSITAEQKQVLLSAIALMRTEEAMKFLIERIADDNRTSAVAAIAALASRRHDPAIVQRVRGAVRQRDEAGVTHAFEAHFSPAR